MRETGIKVEEGRKHPIVMIYGIKEDSTDEEVLMSIYERNIGTSVMRRSNLKNEYWSDTSTKINQRDRGEE